MDKSTTMLWTAVGMMEENIPKTDGDGRDHWERFIKEAHEHLRPYIEADFPEAVAAIRAADPTAFPVES